MPLYYMLHKCSAGAACPQCDKDDGDGGRGGKH